MPTSDEKVSAKAQGEQKSDSVYDFLYHDARRIGSFLAQFDDAGHLQRITQSESASKHTRRGFKVNLSGGATVLGTGGQGGVGFERGPAEHGQEEIERVYDPLWTNALTLLDYLTERDLIEHNLSQARLGQFVLATGTLTILDLVMLQSAWKLAGVQKLIQGGATAAASDQMQGLSRQERRKLESVGASARQTGIDQAKLLIDLLSVLPHAVQARLNGHSTTVWCSLRQDSIVGASSDLVLKHGITVPGEWHMMGILDAMPEQTTISSAIPAGLAGSIVGQMAEALAPITRHLLGRPPEAFGMTPLLIFREVSGQKL